MKLEKEIPGSDAFSAIQPFSDFILTKQGQLMVAVEFEGVDPDILTDKDYGGLAYLGRRVMELLPPGSSLTQYLIRLDNQKIHLRDRENPISQMFSKARENDLNARGVNDTRIIHVYSFEDADNASSSFLKDMVRNLPFALIDEQSRARVKDRLRYGNSLLLNREALERSASSAEDILQTVIGQWDKMSPCRRLSNDEFWNFLRFFSDFDPKKLEHRHQIPADDLDIAVFPGEIAPSVLNYDSALKISGAETTFVRIGSVTTFGSEPIGWLTKGANAPLHINGSYVLVSHFSSLQEAKKKKRFFDAKSSLERSRISLIRMMTGETQAMEEETSRRFRKEVDNIDIAEASDDVWGMAFNMIVVADSNPSTVNETVKRLHNSMTARNVSVVWENAGLPMAYQSFQPGGFGHSLRTAMVSSSRMGFSSPMFKSLVGQPVVDDPAGEEATYIFETDTGEPFHFSGYVGGKNFLICCGPTRSGKTFFKNTVATHFMKFGGLLRAVDIDAGTKYVAEVFGEDGGYVDFASSKSALNPFSMTLDKLDAGNDAEALIHIERLMRMMLQANTSTAEQTLSKGEQESLDTAIKAVLRMPPEKRNLAILLDHLPRDLRANFKRWSGDGGYAQIFGASKDDVALDKRITAWNLEAHRDNPAALKPILFDLFYRTARQFEDPKNRGIPKLVDIDEAHHALAIPEFREFIVSKIRTWGKRGAGVSLWSQSPAEYARTEDWDAIRSAATTFIFMPDGRMNEELYQSTFKLGASEVKAIKDLSKGEAFIVQPDIDVRKKVILRADPLQYAINTSTPHEIEIREQLITEHGTLEGLRRAATIFSDEKSKDGTGVQNVA